MVPAIPGAARAYTMPVVEAFVAQTRDPSSNLAGATVALYMTHAYLNGGRGVGDSAGGWGVGDSAGEGAAGAQEPGGGASGGGGGGGRTCPARHRKFKACFPLGDFDSLTVPPCGAAAAAAGGSGEEGDAPTAEAGGGAETVGTTTTDWAESVPTFACQVGAYTRQLVQLKVCTFCGIRWVASLCQFKSVRRNGSG